MTAELLRAVAVTLREAIMRLGELAATYGVGARKMIEGYAYFMTHAR